MIHKNVIFDFGGVLIQWKPQEIAARFYSDESLRDILLRRVFKHPDWIEMDRGTLSDEIAAQRFAARMNRPIEEMTRLLQHVRDSLTPIAESFALVQQLERRGLALYGLSNMAASTFAHLRTRYDVWRAFRGIVISGEVRMVKPEARIFEYISRLYDLVPHETIFIDDLRHNIEAAKQFGFQTILFSDSQQCVDELEAILRP
jgi:putative hydrolase of the HAD superfamily